MTQFRCMGVRMFAAFLLFTGVFGYLAWHLYHVQIRRHNELLNKGKEKYSTTKVTEGNMGEIFDHSGYLLVGNKPYGIIFADPSAVPEKKLHWAATFLSKELSLDWQKVFKGLAKKSKEVTKNGKKRVVPVQYFLLKNKIPYGEFEEHRKKIEQAKLRFVHFRTEYARYYPKGGMLVNMLGISTINKGKITPVNGLEKTFAQSTRSTSGKITYDRARDGLPIAGGVTKEIDEKDGANHFLTIREPIQSILEEELDKLMEEHKPKSAYAIMADPHTGDIYAMAQRPSFDPNDRSSMKSESWRNRMAEDVFEPGSIIKPFAVAGALDRGIITPETVFDCENGRWYYGGYPLKDDHKIGKVTVSEIIKQSSNIGTAKIAVLMGKNALDETLRAFGFGSRSGLQLPNESRGLYRNVNQWAKVSLTRIPIGQGMAASPLQLVRGYCMLANGGYPVKLRILDRTVTADGKIHRKEVEKTGSIYKDPSTHKKIVEMMKLVTEPGGTASQAGIRGFYVAGKTGTAQKVIGGKYSNKHHIASFVGFVPADNPRLVLLVTADEPSGKTYYGGSVTGPYFSRIAERTLRYLSVPPDVEMSIYDARRRLAEKRVMAAKIRQWRAERQARETRMKKSSGHKDASSIRNTRRENIHNTPSSRRTGNRENKSSTQKRYYGTYTALMKNR